jgi:hypothetical protein
LREQSYPVEARAREVMLKKHPIFFLKHSDADSLVRMRVRIVMSVGEIINPTIS